MWLTILPSVHPSIYCVSWNEHEREETTHWRDDSVRSTMVRRTLHLFIFCLYIYIFFSSNTYIIYIFLSAMLWWTKLCVCTRRMGFDHDRASTTAYVIVPCSQHFGWKSSATTDVFNLSYRHKQGGSSVPKCWSTPNFLDLINLICLWRRRGSYCIPTSKTAVHDKLQRSRPATCTIGLHRTVRYVALTWSKII